MHRTTIALAAAAALLLGACGTGEDGAAGTGASGGTSTAPEPSSEAPPSDAPSHGAAGQNSSEGPEAFPASTDDESADQVGDYDLVLTDVRAGAHDGFDRIVLEFSGSGEPGWQVGWVDRAVADGSGDAVTLDGEAVLAVVARGTTYPEEGAEQYDGPPRLDLDGGAGVQQVAVVGTFEGDTQVFAGVDGGRRPFRVFKLASPTRLVVDVSNAA